MPGWSGVTITPGWAEIRCWCSSSPRKDRIDCGHWLKFGWTGDGFAMILDRRYDRCRGVPYDFWPKVWYPTSWRYADAPPSNGGDAPPATKEVDLSATEQGGERS